MLETSVKLAFWASVALLAYAYVLYPLGMWLASRRRKPWIRTAEDMPNGVSVLLAVRNEATHLSRRLQEFTSAIARAELLGEIIVVSDGSTDSTVQIAEEFAGQGVRLIRWDQGRGKAAALTSAASLARYDILVMADARQTWEPDALMRLLENFADPDVGAVSGELVLEVQPGVLAGVGLYWRFEKWLRRQESRFHSQIGVTGAIAAVRRTLFKPIPEGMILDDVYWPMQVVMQGRRVVNDERAVAYDRLPATAGGEMRRKVRTLVGNFQLIAAVPSLLSPAHDPAWLAFLSHKALRLVAPWAMIVALATSALASGRIYGIALSAQLLMLAAALLGLSTAWGSRNKVCVAAGSFLLLHVAAWIAFWVWILGRSHSVWQQPQFSPLTADGASSA